MFFAAFPTLGSLTRCTVVSLVIVISTACQTAVIERKPYTEEEVKAEGIRHEIAQIQANVDTLKRITDIGYPILREATDLCGPEWVWYDDGINIYSLDTIAKDRQEAAKEGFGLTYRPQVKFVTKGSPADQAGVQAGDQIIVYQGIPVTEHKGSMDDLNKALTDRGEIPAQAFPYRFRRNNREYSTDIVIEQQCAYNIHVSEQPIVNAFADGQNIVFTKTIMTLLDDYQLAVIFGHEAAHNIMAHGEKHRANRLPAQAAGLAADIMLALLGVNTQGTFTNMAAEAATMQFSADFEAEADVVGMYLLARAGYPYKDASNLWRRMSTTKKGTESIYTESSHPPNAERYLILQDTAQEIDRLKTEGKPLDPPLPDSWTPRLRPKPVATTVTERDNQR